MNIKKKAAKIKSLKSDAALYEGSVKRTGEATVGIEMIKISLSVESKKGITANLELYLTNFLEAHGEKVNAIILNEDMRAKILEKVRGGNAGGQPLQLVTCHVETGGRHFSKRIIVSMPN